jgi:putative sigma-54 modulation protein
MGIDITARHVKIPDVVKEHAQKRLTKIVEEFPRIENVHVILSVEKYRHTAEVLVEGKRSLRMQALETSDNMYAAIDVACDKIEKQLRRAVEKRQRHHKGKVPLSDAAEQLEGEKDDESA